MTTVWVDAVAGSLDQAMKHLEEKFGKFPTGFTGLNGKHKQLTRDIANLVVELTAARDHFPVDSPGAGKEIKKRVNARTRK